MKKYNYLLAGLFAASALVACNDDDFLKEEPKTIYTVETAFEKSSQVDAAIARAYINFNYMFGWHNLYIDGSAASNLLGGDGSDMVDNGINGAQMAGTMFSNFPTLNSNTTIFNTTWNELYQLAANANLAMYGAEQVKWSNTADKDYAIAQARFLRGFAYLRLGECFGGVPIVETFSDELRYDYARSTREETYAFAIADFEAAIKGLPGHPKADGRAAQGIAKHYLAEAYLAQGVETGNSEYFKLASVEALEVINEYPLMTERFGVRANPSDTGTTGYLGVKNYKEDGNVYYDLFQMGNYNASEGNTEALMVMQAPTYDEWAVNGGNRLCFGCTVGCVYRDLTFNDEEIAKNKAAFGESASNGPWNDKNVDQGSCYLGGTSWGLEATTDYADEEVWKGEFANDLRNSQIVRCDPVVQSEHSIHKGEICKKEWLKEPVRLMRTSCKIAMQDGWGWDSHNTAFGGQTFIYQYGRDWYIARSAETYLLAAEAFLRMGQPEEAAKYVNKVRERAHATKTFDTVTMRDILDERARELVFEEHRWATLLRLGASNGTNEDMNYQLTHFTSYVNDNGMKCDAPKWNLFPIPLTVINLNKDVQLEQNPGWD